MFRKKKHRNTTVDKLELRKRPRNLTLDELKSMIPTEFDFLQVLKEGSFSVVFNCLKKNTKEVVAIKVPLVRLNTQKEEILMKKLTAKKNIIKFFGSFKTPFGKAMIFEHLETNLKEYLRQEAATLPLDDIRSIIQQLATALFGLKKERIIYGDLKFNNVMLVNKNRPLQVKLIDFEMVTYQKAVKKGTVMNLVKYRAPELLLGLTLTGALDVWAVGIMMMVMAIGKHLFPCCIPFEMLKIITKLIGPIPDNLLHQAMWTSYYFNTDGTHFRMKTDIEFVKSDSNPFKKVQTFSTEKFTSLEELIETFVEANDQQESDELDAFTDLLTHMLEIDGEKRITPAQILKHPFICGTSTIKFSSVASRFHQKPSRPVSEAPQPMEGFRCSMMNPLTPEEIENILPKKYSLIKLQTNGQFGQLFKCEVKQTKVVHSVKLPHCLYNTQKETELMRRMMYKGLEQRNIVHCMAFVKMGLGKALIYEELDMNLTQYMAANHHLALGDVRSIVQQTATAITALKSMRVIHTEATLDNVWLCAQCDPLKVKLTNFELSIHPKRVQPGMKLQNLNYRAPEVILGLPFSGAIDVWSLGTMMASMLLGFDLFPNQSEFETLKVMVKYFGKLPDDILSKGLKTDIFYNKCGKSWNLMTDQEFVKTYHLAPGDIQVYRSESFSTFEELIRNNFQGSSFRELQELQEYIDLMHQMLEMKEADRITPAQIIDHPALSKSAVSKQESRTTLVLEKSDSTTPLEKPVQKPVSSHTIQTSPSVATTPAPRPMIVRSTPEGHTPPLQEPERPKTRKVDRPPQCPEKDGEKDAEKDDWKGATKGTDSELEPAPKLHHYDEGDRRGATNGSDSELEPTPKLHHYDEDDQRGATKGSDSKLEPPPKLHHYDENNRRGATKGSDSKLEPAPKFHHYDEDDRRGATKGSDSELEPAPKFHHYDEDDRRGATKGSDSELEPAPKFHHYDEDDRRGARKGSDSELETAPKLHHYNKDDRRGAAEVSHSELEPAPKVHHYNEGDRRGAVEVSHSELEPEPKVNHYNEGDRRGATKGSNPELEPALKHHHHDDHYQDLEPLPHYEEQSVLHLELFPYSEDHSVQDPKPLPHSTDQSRQEPEPLSQSEDQSVQDLKPLPHSTDQSGPEPEPLSHSNDQSVQDLEPLPHSEDQSVLYLEPLSHSEDQSVQDPEPLPHSEDQSVLDLEPLPHSEAQSLLDLEPLPQSEDQSIQDLEPLHESEDQSVLELELLPHFKDQSMQDLEPFKSEKNTVPVRSLPTAAPTSVDAGLQTSRKGYPLCRFRRWIRNIRNRSFK